MTPYQFISLIVIACAATALTDLWALLLKRLGIAGLNMAMLGRWFGHFFQGQWYHASIAQAQPIAYERILGWLLHYLIGIVFALLFFALTGPAWLNQPQLMPALGFALLTVVCPFFIMQPALGLGFAAAKTAAPGQNRLKSLLNHLLFGLGLYLSAWLIACFTA